MTAPLDPLRSTRIRLLPMYPFSIVLGGFELQCVKTHAALRTAGLSAELLDYYRADDAYDILHLFGSTGNYYDLCQHVPSSCEIVVSAISGARDAGWLRGFVGQTTARIVGLWRSQTTYARVRAVLHRASAVLCLNQLEADFMRATYEVPESVLHIVTNGVEDHFFSATGEPFVERYGMSEFVLYTGNITERKNPLRLAQTLRRLNYPGVFIGGTMHSEQAYAQAFAEVVEGAPNLLWIPRLPHDDGLLAHAYAAARVLCLPSMAETQSLTALEAMATGTPLILGGFPYAYQSPFEGSLKCDPRDDAALARCLDQAMNAPSRYSVRLDDGYRWSAIGREIADVYRHVVERKSSRSFLKLSSGTSPELPARQAG